MDFQSIGMNQDKRNQVVCILGVNNMDFQSIGFQYFLFTPNLEYQPTTWEKNKIKIMIIITSLSKKTL